jgi:hypothetical protein
MVSRVTGGGYLEVYHSVKVYWWRLSSGITRCQGLLVEVILRYIMVVNLDTMIYLKITSTRKP